MTDGGPDLKGLYRIGQRDGTGKKALTLDHFTGTSDRDLTGGRLTALPETSKSTCWGWWRHEFQVIQEEGRVSLHRLS